MVIDVCCSWHLKAQGEDPSVLYLKKETFYAKQSNDSCQTFKAFYEQGASIVLHERTRRSIIYNLLSNDKIVMATLSMFELNRSAYKHVGVVKSQNTGDAQLCMITKLDQFQIIQFTDKNSSASLYLQLLIEGDFNEQLKVALLPSKSSFA
jgi:hypothetical protein